MGADELHWGLWGARESELRLLSGFESGEDAIELGCGTAEILAWLGRRGMQPVAVDISPAQLRNAESLQRDFNLQFPLICPNPSKRVEFVSDGGVEFHPTHGHWIRLLRATGFIVDDLIEVKPDAKAKLRLDVGSRQWAQRWPSEKIWIAHKAG